MSTNNNESIKNKVQEDLTDTNANNSGDESLNSDRNQNGNCLWKCEVIKKLCFIGYQFFWDVLIGIVNGFQNCLCYKTKSDAKYQPIVEEFPNTRKEHDLQSDVIKIQTKPGGLHNSASTCYMNAMIQALSSSDVLINSLKNISKSHSNSSVSLLYDLLNALNEENINNETLMRNTNLLESLIQSVGWTKLSQQDAFDLLSTLICDIYKNTDKINKIEIPIRLKLIHEFQGIDIRNRVQEYLGLSLNLCGNYQDLPGVSLQFLIDQHFISTSIDGDISKLTRLSLYREIPNILLIHIQANKWDPIKNQMIKPTYYIQYVENMTLWLDIVNEMNGENRNLNEDRILGTEVEYHLKSIVHHVGNISGGHYVAYRKWREEWYLADDYSIKKEPLDKSISPYIMIYERADI